MTVGGLRLCPGSESLHAGCDPAVDSHSIALEWRPVVAKWLLEQFTRLTSVITAHRRAGRWDMLPTQVATRWVTAETGWRFGGGMVQIRATTGAGRLQKVGVTWALSVIDW